MVKGGVFTRTERSQLRRPSRGKLRITMKNRKRGAGVRESSKSRKENQTTNTLAFYGEKKKVERKTATALAPRQESSLPRLIKKNHNQRIRLPICLSNGKGGAPKNTQKSVPQFAIQTGWGMSSKNEKIWETTQRWGSCSCCPTTKKERTTLEFWVLVCH